MIKRGSRALGGAAQTAPSGRSRPARLLSQRSRASPGGNPRTHPSCCAPAPSRSSSWSPKTTRMAPQPPPGPPSHPPPRGASRPDTASRCASLTRHVKNTGSPKQQFFVSGRRMEVRIRQLLRSSSLGAPRPYVWTGGAVTSAQRVDGRSGGATHGRETKRHGQRGLETKSFFFFFFGLERRKDKVDSSEWAVSGPEVSD